LWLLRAAPAQQATEPSPLTLQQAVKIALDKNPLRKAALADTKVASADIGAARSVLMPRLAFSETATRGNDPVYVFGSELRQRRFTNADLTLPKLNTPSPIGNFSTRFGGTWNLFDSFASWHGMNRAKEMNEAAGHQLERTEQEIVFRVADSYYAVLLATKQLEVSEQAVKTSQSILDRSQARFERFGSGVRLANREGAHGSAKAGTHPGQEQSGSGAGPVKHRDGCAGGLLVPAG
jgi:outer membrane protein TolC